MEIFLTTSELIEETEKQIDAAGMPGVHINYTKLLRWQRSGLLPRQKSIGAGPGERQESLWDESCIGRLQVIAYCVKAERLNRKNAEHALIAAGFGVRGDLLSKHLLTYCKKMSAELKKQQRSGNSDPVDRAFNMERSTSDRMSAHGELAKVIFAACRLGYADLSGEAERFKSFADIANFFRSDTLQELIENTPPEQLEFTYRTPAVVSFAALVANLFDLIYGHSKALSMPDLVDNAIIGNLLEKFAPQPSGKLRRKKTFPYSKERVRYSAHLTAVIFYLVYNQHKEELTTLIIQAIFEILRMPGLSVPENIKNMLNSELEKPDELFNLPSLSK